ncbi:hypothetical protein L0P10_16095, partial [Eggerthella lenta]|nr:hypothetical protein [Eggerthella lenta]
SSSKVNAISIVTVEMAITLMTLFDTFFILKKSPHNLLGNITILLESAVNLNYSADCWPKILYT